MGVHQGCCSFLSRLKNQSGKLLEPKWLRGWVRWMALDFASPFNELALFEVDFASPSNELDFASPPNELDCASPPNKMGFASPPNEVDFASPPNRVGAVRQRVHVDMYRAEHSCLIILVSNPPRLQSYWEQVAGNA